MGLDMYLNAKRYVSNYREDEKPIVDAIHALPIERGAMRVKWLEYEAIYWRKANHIHQWFVENCGDGVDECQPMPVGIKQLKELRDVCRKVLADKTQAADLLPTQEGFFFGSTDYDDGYWEDTKRTADAIDDLLKIEALDEFFLEYQASW